MLAISPQVLVTLIKGQVSGRESLPPSQKLGQAPHLYELRLFLGDASERRSFAWRQLDISEGRVLLNGEARRLQWSCIQTQKKQQYTVLFSIFGRSHMTIYT